MRLLDSAETVMIVIGAELASDAADRAVAETLRQAVDVRGMGHQYRRAVVVGDLTWFGTSLFQSCPTITVGGPGVNGVADRFGHELPTAWSDRNRVVIQAALDDLPPRVALWGADAAATADAAQAFVARGWLDAFLDRCWRFRTGAFA
jgi:hypothetical protein